MADRKSGSDMARRIWLAGIGAYGKAFEEGRAQLEKLGGSGSDMFDQLAEKGEQLEMAAKVQGMKLAGKANEVREDLGVEDRIKAMRERLSGIGSDDRLAAIEAKLESIEAKLDAVLKTQAAPKRATTQRTTKTAAKTGTAKKKPAAKKSS